MYLGVEKSDKAPITEQTFHRIIKGIAKGKTFRFQCVKLRDSLFERRTANQTTKFETCNVLQ
jgi:hypothetical protein